MGKVSRRLTIVVFPPLGDWPEVVKLEEQGHKIIKIDGSDHVDDPLNPGHMVPGRHVYSGSDLLDADLIIGPQCWYFDTKHRKYLTQAIKQARLRRYGAPQRKVDKKDGETESLEQ